MTTGLKEAILGDNRIEGGNPGVTTGLKEAILGPRSHWQKKRAAVLPPRDWIFFS